MARHAVSRMIEGKRYNHKSDISVASVSVTTDGRWYLKLVTMDKCEGIVQLSEVDVQELLHKMGICGDVGDWFGGPSNHQHHHGEQCLDS